jgi:hypothetical protein
VVERPTEHNVTLRCVYCEADIDAPAQTEFVLADSARKVFSHGLETLAGASADRLKHLVIYPNEAEALAAGFQPREAGGGRARIG